ncbi:hypothetical protein KUTeg_017380 [Tegillarca granosa]|uniref:Secreted protein n=1 Tax=Tegillarca granosa TaxID=220873 RepID=A0ABQ9EJU3_TEGGR|nr:hypothetical protein KUTeg_017380 [Tegillarca granosa]
MKKNRQGAFVFRMPYFILSVLCIKGETEKTHFVPYKYILYHYHVVSRSIECLLPERKGLGIEEDNK